MDKKKLYEKKYASSLLVPSPYFQKQFQYIVKKYLIKKNPKILDLGGGTGEYSLLLQDLNYDVTLFDFSVEATIKAKNIGVYSIVCDDFLSYKFKDEKYDLIFVKGFSLLNIEDKKTFLSLIERMKLLLNPNGYIIYMGQSDLSTNWSKSGWYQLGISEIEEYFDDYLILPAFRYQVYLPLFLNKIITNILSKVRDLPKSITLLGVIR